MKLFIMHLLLALDFPLTAINFLVMHLLFTHTDSVANGPGMCNNSILLLRRGYLASCRASPSHGRFPLAVGKLLVVDCFYKLVTHSAPSRLRGINGFD